jgi:hypothetical protein
MEAIVHYDRYNRITSAEIDELWAERETSTQTMELLNRYGVENLARIFTEYRYPAAENLNSSKRYLATLREQGFLDDKE